ncbi:MAG: hypothetical protein M1839_009342 [Geoglossum umbratile]|nr:MAG: hypothetical protein M1839_009342 [Geoglossum umbratile]
MGNALRKRQSPACQTTTQTISFVYDPSRVVLPTSGPNKGSPIPAPPRALIENMCNGIEKLSGSPSQNITLEMADDAAQIKNRNAICPSGSCDSVWQDYVKKYYPSGLPDGAKEAILTVKSLQCDEFPFARSKEGGNPSNGVSFCVPGSETGWQGGTMSWYFSPENPKRIRIAEKFVVEIVGWNCTTQQPNSNVTSRLLLRKRAVSDLPTSINIVGAEMYRSFDPTNPKNKLLVMPLGDLTAGSYSIALNATGSLTTSLIDYVGTEYTTTFSGKTLSFKLTQDVFAASLIGNTTDEAVQVMYQLKEAAAPRLGVEGRWVGIGLTAALVLLFL